MHEHLIFGYPGWQYDSAAPPYDRGKAAEVCCAMVGEAMTYGLKTVVDATPNDGQRDPELYKNCGGQNRNKHNLFHRALYQGRGRPGLL
ncbi:MAG: hypothetical protein ACOY40_00430 [Bacillota bacterium]